eukprot:TRINITY_DN165_c5_g1_i1.p1 TRINITY_DN165_c5_g1~~TRINITY_DN165_c5_g1_i1.p1  ORF type:complete len:458 (+),score=173.24 TRINITY_DN165_c5_g1_i1:81-1454(+)
MLEKPEISGAAVAAVCGGDETGLEALLRRSMRCVSPSTLDARALGFKQGTTAATRTVELAFRSYLEHSREGCTTPDNYLRGTGRKMRDPKRVQPLPQLHVLSDTCPPELNRALHTNMPSGLNVMFYEQLGCEHPSRDYHFKRLHLPHMRSMERTLKQHSRNGRRAATPLLDGDNAIPPLPRRAQTSLSGGRPAGAGNGVVSHRTAISTTHDIRSFEGKYGLLDPNEANANGKADDESVDGTDTSAQVTADPCAAASSVARMVYTALRLRKTKLRNLVNIVPIEQAKHMFTASNTPHPDFMLTIGKRLGMGYDEVMLTDVRYAFELLITAPFRPETQIAGKMQKETWMVMCHYLWRTHRQDRDALLKMIHLTFQIREESQRIRKTEVQILLAAYRGQKRHSKVVLKEVEQKILLGQRWAHETLGWRQWQKAVASSPILHDAFIGHSDATFAMRSGRAD